MAVIDAHAHIYPDKIAPKAVEAVGDFYNFGMFGDGTADGLLAAKDRAPITHFIVHSVATTAHAVTAINDFIAKQCQAHPEFIGFAAMQQDFEDPAAELQRAVELGLRGVKLHPDTQKVDMDDPRLMEVYAICEQLGLPVVIHTGDYRYDFNDGTYEVVPAAVFEDAEWSVRLVMEGERRMESNRSKTVALNEAASLDCDGSDWSDAVMVDFLDEENAEMLAEEELRKLYAAMGKLTERQQEIIQLYFYKGLTQYEIAEELGIARPVVSKTMTAAIKKLKKSF